MRRNHVCILRDILTGPKRFGELHKSLNGVSQKVLTENLRGMEADGLVTRTVFPEVPPRVEYGLSELGESLRPISKQMAEWGIGYRKKYFHPRPPHTLADTISDGQNRSRCRAVYLRNARQKKRLRRAARHTSHFLGQPADRESRHSRPG